MKCLLAVCLCLLTLTVPGAAEPAFSHPGLLHGKADLDRIREKLARGGEPWKSGFERLRTHRQSQADYRVRGPFAQVIRDPKGSSQLDELVSDGNAAYQNALMWCLTGNEPHARKAAEILNVWSGTLREITGKDKELGASLCGFKLVNAAELLRHTYPGWSQTQSERCGRMLREAVYPAIRNFATFANGNWDTGCLKTIMAIGVYLDDRELFNQAVNYYRQGAGNGSLAHYVINPAGQCQESGRDQQHTQLGLAHLAEACEIAWHQGLDIYGEQDNRLRHGFEYTARYNLGQEVPFQKHTDTTGKYRHQAVAQAGRGNLRPIFEMVWNHYERRRGIPSPFTRQAAEKIRPEGAAFSADHPGFGTLMFSLPEQTAQP
jgi:hypothetical protein